ncbi:hypothetical protein MKW92_042730 [Papaver armeniacum]|nr:hypothetical protein MKW92_042730 [Papaver armeniacum]
MLSSFLFVFYGKWKSLWTLLPELDFDYVRFCKSFGIVLEHRKKERFRGFLEFVDYVFTHYQVKHLHRLQFGFDISRHKIMLLTKIILLKFVGCLDLR